jgi:adenylate kinase family enzyme
MRIAIIGCGGSGKTTTSRRLGDALHAPVTHLDVLYYDEEWNTLPKEKFAALQEDLVAQDRWVIDGNFASTLPTRLQRATTIIFLDLGPITCLTGIAQRRLRYGGGQNDSTGVYDRIHWGFIKYVWNFRRDMGPRVRKLILEHGTHADVYIVRSRRGANRLVDEIIQRANTRE